jgi:trimeric autotransporter adhesin
LVLGVSAITGNLNGTTGGALTQSGALTVSGITTLDAGTSDITLTNGGNNFSTVGITSGNNVMLTDANAMTLNASNVSGNFSANAGDLTVGGAVASTGGALNLTAANSVTQLANLTAAGANSVTVTAVGGSITMAAAATTTSGTGAINYTSRGNVTLGSLSTGGGVNVIATGGSVISAVGSGTNLTAGANSTLQAFNGIVGTPAAPITVNVNPGTLSIRATTAVAGISAFVMGTVLPGNALVLLNVPPGLVCFNGCTIPSGTNPFSGFFGLAPSFSLDSVVPWYLREPSDPPMISVVSTYLPHTVFAEAKTDVKSDNQSVAREIPPCFPESA